MALLPRATVVEIEPRAYASSPPETPPGAARGRHQIVELHGLRGLALVLVVSFHLFGAGRVSGGVDVFLAVSGFLATYTLLRHAEGDGIKLSDHYSRVLARLVPPALVVLAATAALTVLLMPRARWIDVGREVVASAAFFQNQQLIASRLEYDAAAPVTSPLQHFWSLSVQAQFLLLIPLVVLLIVGLCRLTPPALGLTPRRVTAVVLAAAAVTSFVYARQLGETFQARAYLDSFTRVWELAVGGLLATVIVGNRLPHLLRAMLAWAGLGMVASAGFLIDGAAAYPGPQAWWPVGGALLVLIGAGSQTRWSPRVMLQLRPLRRLADISYELYLWHWPLLIFYLFVLDRDVIRWHGAASLMAAALVLAWATNKLVAHPITRIRIRHGAPPILVGGVALTAIAAVAAHVWVVDTERDQKAEQAALQSLGEQHPGAAVLAKRYDGPTSFDTPFVPSPFVANLDKSPSVRAECASKARRGASVAVCDAHVPDNPTRTVILVGASHMSQWESAFLASARAQGWHLQVISKPGCRLQYVEKSGDCPRWGRAVMEHLLGADPDAVIVEATDTRAEAGKPIEYVNPGQVRAWRELDAAGIAVIGLRDNPRAADDVLDCIDRHGPDATACPVAPVADQMPTPVGKSPTMFHTIDMTPWICPAKPCPLVVGNVLVYRNDHLTDSYVRTMAPMLDAELRAGAPPEGRTIPASADSCSPMSKRSAPQPSSVGRSGSRSTPPTRRSTRAITSERPRLSGSRYLLRALRLGAQASGSGMTHGSCS